MWVRFREVYLQCISRSCSYSTKANPRGFPLRMLCTKRIYKTKRYIDIDVGESACWWGTRQPPMSITRQYQLWPPSQFHLLEGGGGGGRRGREVSPPWTCTVDPQIVDPPPACWPLWTVQSPPDHWHPPPVGRQKGLKTLPPLVLHTWSVINNWEVTCTRKVTHGRTSGTLGRRQRET